MLQNKKYIKFANDNTVEVLSLGRLDEGIKKEDPKAATYVKKKKGGDKTEYLVQWPNLTVDMVAKLRRSKAGTYNDTGKIPYTCLVNPYTLERIRIIKRPNTSTIMDEVVAATKLLKKEHGKGMKRKTVNKINKAITAGQALASKGDFDGGYKAIDKAAPKPQNLPSALQEKLKASKDAITATARARLDEIKAMDTKLAKRAISRFMGKAKKTGLLEEAREYLVSLKNS